MSDTHQPTRDQLMDPDYTPPLSAAIPLGLQHVLAMFVSNFTPAIIIALAVGYGFGSPDMIFLIQMAMIFSGIATLIQTLGVGPIGARLPVMQGTSFAFIPVMIPVVKTAGMGALFGSVLAGGIFHLLLGTVIGRIRFLMPPLITGIVVLGIGLMLIPVGIDYAAGGVPLKGKPEFGAWYHWLMAMTVIAVALGVKFSTKGMVSSAAVLIGLIAGYVLGLILGEVDSSTIANASWFALPKLAPYGLEFHFGAILAMCLLAFVSAIETVGDISGITKGGANREATEAEIRGGTYADGLGSAIAAFFGALPNTSFSQNVGLIAMTGVMSRMVVTIGAIFLVVAGLIPKIGAIVASMPIAVLGGGVIVMFGMVASAGINMLSEVKWNRRNMVILAVSLSIGLGMKAVPEAMQHWNETLVVLLKSGLLPMAVIAIALNYFLPEEDH